MGLTMENGENNMEENSLVVQKNTEIASYNSTVYGRERMSNLIDEAVVSVKDYRLNTKRAISADIASTARVQNQYEQYVLVCKRELQRNDLSEERRQIISDSMLEAIKASEEVGAKSRRFQTEQLNQSRKLPWEIVGVMMLIIAAGYGGKAMFQR